MLSFNHGNLNKVLSALLLSLMVSVLPTLVRADDLTGASQDDPKDLLPTPPTTTLRTSTMFFLPMPSWARGVVMPPLPYQLKPMGKKPANLVSASEAASLTPPPDGSTTPTGPVAKPKAPPVENNPDLITVSPFLQWIKSNPQAAAAEARRQANAYGAPPSAPGIPGNPNGAPSTAGSDDNYWLPPLIDSGDFGPKPVVSGSAAIYQTPQR
jgi:hypothetical protein